MSSANLRLLTRAQAGQRPELKDRRGGAHMRIDIRVVHDVHTWIYIARCMV